MRTLEQLWAGEQVSSEQAWSVIAMINWSCRPNWVTLCFFGFQEFLDDGGVHWFKVTQFIYLQCIAWAVCTLSCRVLRRWMCWGWTATLHDATTDPKMCFFLALCARAIRLHPVSTTQNTLWESDDKVKKRGRQLWRTKILLKKKMLRSLHFSTQKWRDLFKTADGVAFNTWDGYEATFKKFPPFFWNHTWAFFFFLSLFSRGVSVAVWIIDGFKFR